MRFPFVSRERYEEKCAELRELKDELKALRNPQQFQPASVASAEDTQEVMRRLNPGIKRRLTLAEITKQGTEQAQKIANTPGAESVAAQLAGIERRTVERMREKIRPMAPPPPPQFHKSTEVTEEHADAS